MIRRPPRSTRTDTLFPYTTLFRSDLHPGSVGGLGEGLDLHHLPPREADVRTAEKTVRALSYDLLPGGGRRVMEIVGRLSLSRRRGLVLLDRSDCDQTGRDQRLQLPLPGGVSVAAQVDGERQRKDRKRVVTGKSVSVRVD